MSDRVHFSGPVVVFGCVLVRKACVDNACAAALESDLTDPDKAVLILASVHHHTRGGLVLLQDAHAF